MSPKSRGRPPGRGREKKGRTAPRELRLSDRVVRDAREVLDAADVLTAEMWASEWLGRAWSAAGLGEREPEHELCLEVTGRVCTHPSASGRAAVEALRRVAPPESLTLLDQTLEILAAQPSPGWSADPPWAPVSAARAVTVWQDERALFVEFAGPRPHALYAVVQEVGGTVIDRLQIVEPDAAARFAALPDRPGDVPMPLAPAPVEDVLADLAEALARMDMYWPRPAEPDYVDARALAWSRARPYRTDPPEWEPISDADRDELVEAFVTTTELPDDDVHRSLAELFIDYGDGYIPAGPLAWSPGWVGMFLADYLPRKVALDQQQRHHLADALRAWLRFALERQAVEPPWVDPVVAAVDEWLPEFEEAFDDERAWGPAKQIAADLTARGVDLTDRDAVDDAMRALNAERLARQLHDE